MDYASRYYGGRSGDGGGGIGGSEGREGGADDAAGGGRRPPPPPRPRSSESKGPSLHPPPRTAAENGGTSSPPPDSSRVAKSSPPRHRYNPVERYAGLEEEMFRLKFERAHVMEEEEAAALKERKCRKEMVELRERLRELRAEMDGEEEGCGYLEDHQNEGMDTDRAVRDESGGKEREKCDCEGDVGGRDGMKEEPEPLLPADRRPSDSGLHRKRDVLESQITRLKRDVELLKSDIRSIRTDADRVLADLSTARDDGVRARERFDALEERGEDSSREVIRLQFSARQAVRNRVESTMRKEAAEDGAARMRAKLEALNLEIEEQRAKIAEAGDDARRIRSDAAHTRKQNERMRDKMLMTTNPEEYRKRKAAERRRKKMEKHRGHSRSHRDNSGSDGERIGGGQGGGNWISRSVRSVASMAGDLAASQGHHRDGDVGKESVDDDDHDGRDDDDTDTVATGRYTVA